MSAVAPARVSTTADGFQLCATRVLIKFEYDGDRGTLPLFFHSTGSAEASAVAARADGISGFALGLLFKRQIATTNIPLAIAATHLVLCSYDQFEFLVISQSTVAVSRTRKNTDVLRPTFSLSASKIP
jgi:hypothetical protein